MSVMDGSGSDHDHDHDHGEKTLVRFVVDRSKWYRGNGSNGSSLLRGDGTRCCVGFLAKALGLPDEEILERPTLGRVGVSELVASPWFGIDLELWRRNVYPDNDIQTIDDMERETILAKSFAECGYEVVFVDRIEESE